jgi:hypothetical protein
MRLTIFLAITTPQFLPFTFLLVPTDRSKFWRVACRRDRGRCRPIAPDSMGLPQLAPCRTWVQYISRGWLPAPIRLPSFLPRRFVCCDGYDLPLTGFRWEAIDQGHKIATWWK